MPALAHFPTVRAVQQQSKRFEKTETVVTNCYKTSDRNSVENIVTLQNYIINHHGGDISSSETPRENVTLKQHLLTAQVQLCPMYMMGKMQVFRAFLACTAKSDFPHDI